MGQWVVHVLDAPVECCNAMGFGVSICEASLEGIHSPGQEVPVPHDISHSSIIWLDRMNDQGEGCQQWTELLDSSDSARTAITVADNSTLWCSNIRNLKAHLLLVKSAVSSDETCHLSCILLAEVWSVSSCVICSNSNLTTSKEGVSLYLSHWTIPNSNFDFDIRHISRSCCYLVCIHKHILWMQSQKRTIARVLQSAGHLSFQSPVWLEPQVVSNISPDVSSYLLSVLWHL